MAIECYFDKCKFHASHDCKDVEDCEGPICDMRECVQPSINRFLTEGLLEKCWHSNINDVNYGWLHYCVDCGEGLPRRDEAREDLFTGDGFFLLWEKAQKQVWWEDFWFNKLYLQHSRTWEAINPQTFLLLAEYLGWEAEA